MASLCSARFLPSPSLDILSTKTKISSDSRSLGCSSSRVFAFSSVHRSSSRRNRNQLQVVSMAPEEEKLTRRNPLDFPIVSSRVESGLISDLLISSFTFLFAVVIAPIENK